VTWGCEDVDEDVDGDIDGDIGDITTS